MPPQGWGWGSVSQGLGLLGCRLPILAVLAFACALRLV